MERDILDAAINDRNYPEIGRLLDERPGRLRKLMSRLHETGEMKLEATLEAYQIAAKVLDRETMLDHARRLMWMLNEESGNNCPNAALALGHIAQVIPDGIVPHLPVLRVYAEDPSPQLREPVRQAIVLIRRAAIRNGVEMP